MLENNINKKIIDDQKFRFRFPTKTGFVYNDTLYLLDNENEIDSLINFILQHEDFSFDMSTAVSYNDIVKFITETFNKNFQIKK